MTITNYNTINKTRFKLMIPRAKNLEFFITRWNLPNVHLPPTEQPTPFVNIPIWGDHLDFSELKVEFQLQENFQNYLEIFNWLTGLGRLENSIKFNELKETDETLQRGLKSDIVIQILSSAHNATYDITFHDAFPYYLGGDEFSSEELDSRPIHCSAAFRYSYFTIQSTN